jgi:hypothetical protein
LLDSDERSESGKDSILADGQESQSARTCVGGVWKFTSKERGKIGVRGPRGAFQMSNIDVWSKPSTALESRTGTRSYKYAIERAADGAFCRIVLIGRYGASTRFGLKAAYFNHVLRTGRSGSMPICLRVGRTIGWPHCI